MWMMGYGGDDKGLSNSVNNIKLQPLVKRTKNTTHSPISIAYASNGHLVATATDWQSTREKNADPVVSSRWNPTREQIQVLEEMYRGGIRTPTAEQIQKIVGKLRRFGRIEGKNIFYWFQNHKARERQKRRRLLESSCGGLRDIDKVGKQDLVLSKRGLEDVQKHKWVTPSNCSTISEESVSIHRAVIAECKAEKRIQVEERELQERDKHSVTGCEDESRKFQTLQLFPISRGIRDDCNVVDGVNNDAKIPINTIATNFNPVQFFEFLPLKD